MLAAPASAQQDERFYGRWEPSSTPAAGSILYVDPGGYLSSLLLNAKFSNERYEVIRDFGDRLVERIWPLGNEPWELIARESDELAVLEIRRDTVTRYDMQLNASQIDREYVSHHFCTSPAAQEYFFKDYDPDNVWRRIQEWSARSDEGFPYGSCHISPVGGKFGESWGTMSWVRDIDSHPE